MRRGTAEWFKWYIHTCWEEEAGELLAETHALALRVQYGEIVGG